MGEVVLILFPYCFCGNSFPTELFRREDNTIGRIPEEYKSARGAKTRKGKKKKRKMGKS
ncbi:MAG: hypothetical protein MR020_06530 [Lachnospiraceae bacterium]|nr:hypothetical protein [Lachnospiraceae bacterium]